MRRRPVGLSVLVLATLGGLGACSASSQKVAPAPRGSASARASAAPFVGPAECTTETYDCDGDPANGCEARRKSPYECGPCGCLDGEHCREGTCVRDAKLASSADTGYTCAIAPDGRVACWGTEGRADDAAQATPRWWPKMKDAVAVRSGHSKATCAIDRAGSTFCSADGEASQLSEKGVIDLTPNTQRLLLDDGRLHNLADTYYGFQHALAVAETSDQVCVLSQEGQVSCVRSWWSSKWDADVPRPGVFHKVGEVTHLAAGYRRMCVVSRPGNVVCWDYWVDEMDRKDMWGEPIEKNGIEDAVEVAPGKQHTCVLRKNGEVLCWGAGGDGELGDGTRHSSETPVTVANLKDAIHVVAGDGHSCAMRKGGQVVCWGARRSGGLGDGRINVRVLPTEIEGIDDAVSVSGAMGRTCALRRSGKVSCWGLGGIAHGPPGSPVRGLPPVEVPGLTNLRSLVVDASACATDDQGRAFCWPGAAPNVPGRGPVRIEGLPPAAKVYGPKVGSDQWPHEYILSMPKGSRPRSLGLALLRSGEMAIFRPEGEAVDGVQRVRSSIAAGLSDVVDIDGSTGLFLRRSGAVARLELRHDESLGRPKQTWRYTPRLGLRDVVQLSSPCVTHRTGKVSCWNTYQGEYDKLRPWEEVSEVAEVQWPAPLRCARLRSGRVFCGGDNWAGQLGTGNTDTMKTGVFVKGLEDAVSLSVTEDCACAVRGNGHVVCWGSNDLDQTGGDSPSSPVPQEVAFPSD